MSAEETVKSLKCSMAWATNATLTNTFTSFLAPSLTAPVSDTTELYILPACPPNGVAVKPYLSGSGGAGTLRIMGFTRRMQGTALYYDAWGIGSWTLAAGTTSVTFNSGTLYPIVTFTEVDGDAKAYESLAAAKMGGWLSADCWMFDMVGVALNASAQTGNMLVAVW